VACSGDTVSVTARTVADAKAVLSAIVGHDDKDGTSLSDAQCAQVVEGKGEVRRVAVLTALTEVLSDEEAAKLNAFRDKLTAKGIAVTEVDDQVFKAARVAWNILMTAELCNNVSRYDGIKYGYRSESFTNIDELYTNSRTEAFGELLKTAILFGSETLSTENYNKVYDKALRVRRVLVEAFAALFAEYDAVLLPVCSKSAYTEADVAEDKYLCFSENLYTAPASITGLPSVVVGGVALMGKAFSEQALLAVAALYEEVEA
jgi:aspartyl-tRNA(Asn)/glutamyl-tRNA(Gln) amidotransferase subunit A